MPELDQPSQELFGQFERVTALGEPVTAAEHPAFQTLLEMGLGNIDPAMVVARQRTTHRSDTETLRARTVVECLTAEARRILTDLDDNPTVGSVTIVHQTHIPFEIYGHRNNEPFTQLRFEIDADGTVAIEPSGSIPFGPELQAATTQSWREWGGELDYAVSEMGGHFAFTLIAAPKETLQSRLGQIS